MTNTTEQGTEWEVDIDGDIILSRPRTFDIVLTQQDLAAMEYSRVQANTKQCLTCFSDPCICKWS